MKVYSSVALSAFTLMGNHHLIHPQNFLIFPNWNSIPIKQQLPKSPSSQGPASTPAMTLDHIQLWLLLLKNGHCDHSLDLQTVSVPTEYFLFGTGPSITPSSQFSFWAGLYSQLWGSWIGETSGNTHRSCLPREKGANASHITRRGAVLTLISQSA